MDSAYQKNDMNKLEIEIAQLKELFGRPENEYDFVANIHEINENFDLSEIKSILTEDFYKQTPASRDEIFVKSLYEAVYNSKPTNEGLIDLLASLKKNSEGYQGFAEEFLTKTRKVIDLHNSKNDEISNETIKNIDRWNRLEKISAWK